MDTSAALRQQIAEVENRISNLRFQLAVEQQVLNRLQTAANPSGRASQNTPSETPLLNATDHKPPAVMKGSLADHARAVLRERRRPMRARDITAKLRERGLSDGPKTTLLALTISALRRRRDLFRKIRRGVYGLAIPEQGGNDA